MCGIYFDVRSKVGIQANFFPDGCPVVSMPFIKYSFSLFDKKCCLYHTLKSHFLQDKLLDSTWLISQFFCSCPMASCHYVLTTSKKAEHTEKSTTFLGSVRGVRIQGKPLPLRLEGERGGGRESQLTRAEVHVEATAGTSAEEEILDCNWWIAGDSMWTSLRDETSRGTQSWGTPTVL